jgi:O-acetyl-ADP-ribose deacetylase (regulator of RNase III)
MVALGAGAGGMPLRESVRIACEALLEHDESTDSQIGRVVFYGFGKDEFLPVAKEVSQLFPDALDHLPKKTRRLIAQLEGV